MADAVVNTPNYKHSRLNTQQLAWGVLLLAFAMFCLVCLVSGLGLHYFLFRSTVPMPTTLTVGRGSTLVTELENVTEIRNTFDPDIRATIRTASGGQSTLTFYDEQQTERRVLATVTLNSDSSLQLAEMSRPRFNWSTADYSIRLEQVSGRIDLFIPNGEIPAIQMSVLTAQRATVQIIDSGRYSITANEAQVRVETISGSATLIAGEESQVLDDGDRVMYNLLADELTVLTPYVRLLGTNAFDETNVFASNPPAGGAAWGCSNQANTFDNVSGSYGLAEEDGRPILHFTRTGSQQHGETGCFTSQGGSGLDVTGYQYLSVEVLFKINSQSLSGCGERGSECPLMVQLDYIPLGQTAGEFWNHGFFLWNSIPTYPMRCDTCPEVHDMVNSGSWYRYRTDNLFPSFSPESRPARILALRVYSSGHEYDAYIGEMSLYASEEIDTIPVGDPSLMG